MRALTGPGHLGRALAVLAVPALLAVACSGSPSNGNQANQNAEVQALRWTQCMNQHGVHARASAQGNGVSMAVPAPGQQGGPSRQQLQAAQNACKQYQPSGGQSSRAPSAQEMDQMNRYVQCLNQHGASARVQGNGIEEQPGPGGPAQEQRADQACQRYQPGH